MEHFAKIALNPFIRSQQHGLGLAKVQDSLVSDVAKRGVSGGERKRVNVALELAAAPSVLVLDEPTSGLDATTALSLIEPLKALSEQGVTISVLSISHGRRFSLL